MISSDNPSGKKHVFVSRSLSSGSLLLTRLEDLGFRVSHEPLIRTVPIRFTHTPATRWIFFSSKNAIRHFFAQAPLIPDEVRFGVMSRNSAACLQEFGKTADFTGEGVDVSQIAKDFAACVKDETVLFPQAIDSIQSIQKHLSFTNICHNLFVYKTILRADFGDPEADILVFTSPSNVQAYFEKHPLRSGQRVVAIGSTTLKRLSNFGVNKAYLSASFDEAGLLEAVIRADQDLLLP
jgi:hydroxymethylbilane synthase